jgi:hypothetical protein
MGFIKFLKKEVMWRLSTLSKTMWRIFPTIRLSVLFLRKSGPWNTSNWTKLKTTKLHLMYFHHSGRNLSDSSGCLTCKLSDITKLIERMCLRRFFEYAEETNANMLDLHMSGQIQSSQWPKTVLSTKASCCNGFYCGDRIARLVHV